MLTDTKIKNLKPREKAYKVADREGLYVSVLPGGTISFRYDYRFNGRRETLTIGKYGPDGISLAEAREQLNTAKKLISSGVSPSAAKRDGKKQIAGADRLNHFTVRYMEYARLADSTRAMKQAVIDRDILPALGNKLMTEITTTMVRDLCDRIVARGGRATAVQAREIIASIYRYATDRGHEFINPAERIRASSIATFEPRVTTLTPAEIGLFFRALDNASTMATLKLAVKFVMLTMVRKSEFTHASWDEIDFKRMLWKIPAERMKGSREHVIPLSTQANDLLVGLKMCAGGSHYLLPGRYDMAKPLSNAALNRVLTITIEAIRESGEKIKDFTVHDIRRTASTLLHEAGYPSDWIEKSLAHEQKGVRAVYNKAEYLPQRTFMLQQWADMVDGWTEGSIEDLVPFSPLKFEQWMSQRSG
ncbi:tyrosine-type recombinase/integrase [Pantoea ananatis]|uniref:tyrosine-type recombinase/integrase n=1 Tax=Pantoea ananas TaxID=553 RepID=UPI001B30B594|nr:site-specific integrase [Pantoea ananatis]